MNLNHRTPYALCEVGKPSRRVARGRRPLLLRVSADQFREARRASGMTRREAAFFLGVALRTVGQWETAAHRVPYAAFKLLRVYRHGDLIDPRWSGYRIIRGKLVTPEDHEFVPADMAWLSLLVRRASAFSDLLAQRDGRVRTARERRSITARHRALHDAACIATPQRAESETSRVLQPAAASATVLPVGPVCWSGSRENPPNPLGGYSSRPPEIATSRDLPAATGCGDSVHEWNDGRLPPCSNTGWILQDLARRCAGVAL